MRKRISARPRSAALAVAVAAALLASGMAAALAQTSGASTIELLNPSSHSRVASAEPDGTAPTAYHLNAWVANRPANPFVEFEIRSTGAGTTFQATLPGTPRGPDAFDAFWDLTGAANGSYTVTAILYANHFGPGTGTEVDRDTETFTVQNTDTQTAPRANTVEITEPENGGDWGIYTTPSGVRNGLIHVSYSTGTRFVIVYYTISAPGTEPGWRQCGTRENTAATGAEPFPQGTTRVRCTLQGTDQASQVTGVAAVANDTPSPVGMQSNFNDSGDAHRAIPYGQIPSFVVLPPPFVSETETCTRIIEAFVADQRGKAVVGANVDVHAAGPTDALKFDTSISTPTGAPPRTDPNQPPNSNHAVFESAWNCRDETAGGSQGDHNVPAGPDIKHIESTAPGTNDDGVFRFRLFHRALVAGDGTDTQIVAWADNDDNDIFCANEGRDTTAIRWSNSGDPAPAPPPVEPSIPAEQAAPCGASPSPSPSPSPTTASPSPSPSPSPTTASPSPSPTTSASPSPSATTPPPPPGAARNVTLEASDPKKTFGQDFTLSGAVSPGTTTTPAACVGPGVIVVIRRDVIGGSPDFEERGRATTDAQGNFSANFTADRSGNYIAHIDPSPGCAEANSTAQPVLVKKFVTIDLSRRRVSPGTRVRISGTVSPCSGHEGDMVHLYKVVRGKMSKIATKRTNDSCRVTFSRTIRRENAFQIRAPKQDDDHQGGKSRRRTVLVRR